MTPADAPDLGQVLTGTHAAAIVSFFLVAAFIFVMVRSLRPKDED